MSIDKKHIAAVAALEALGWRWESERWTAPDLIDPEVLKAAAARGAVFFCEANDEQLQALADTLHTILSSRAEALAGAIKQTDDKAKLERAVIALDAHQAMRWPTGKVG